MRGRTSRNRVNEMTRAVALLVLTYQTILENAPFEGAQEVTLAGADEAQLDMEITDETSGIVVRSGRGTFTIGGPAREEAEQQLTTLAETVLGRISALR